MLFSQAATEQRCHSGQSNSTAVHSITSTPQHHHRTHRTRTLDGVQALRNGRGDRQLSGTSSGKHAGIEVHVAHHLHGVLQVALDLVQHVLGACDVTVWRDREVRKQLAC
jgi:hypothetical protein